MKTIQSCSISISFTLDNWNSYLFLLVCGNLKDTLIIINVHKNYSCGAAVKMASLQYFNSTSLFRFSHVSGVSLAPHHPLNAYRSFCGFLTLNSAKIKNATLIYTTERYDIPSGLSRICFSF